MSLLPSPAPGFSQAAFLDAQKFSARCRSGYLPFVVFTGARMKYMLMFNMTNRPGGSSASTERPSHDCGHARMTGGWPP
jgi:hypothetical protein